jgi:hypothetical protein
MTTRRERAEVLRRKKAQGHQAAGQGWLADDPVDDARGAREVPETGSAASAAPSLMTVFFIPDKPPGEHTDRAYEDLRRYAALTSGRPPRTGRMFSQLPARGSRLRDSCPGRRPRRRGHHALDLRRRRRLRDRVARRARDRGQAPDIRSGGSRLTSPGRPRAPDNTGRAQRSTTVARQLGWAHLERCVDRGQDH